MISVHDFTNKISLRDSNYIVNVVMWQKFGNSSSGISMRKGIRTPIKLKLKVRKFWRLTLRL